MPPQRAGPTSPQGYYTPMAFAAIPVPAPPPPMITQKRVSEPAEEQSEPKAKKARPTKPKPESSGLSWPYISPPFRMFIFNSTVPERKHQEAQ